MWSSKNSSGDGQRREKALETSNFAQTCNLLSRYMKEKGSLKNLNLEIGGKVESLEALVKPGSSLAANSDLATNGGKYAQTTSENPVIVVEDDSIEASTSRHGTSKDHKKSVQMTIFYSGKVLVFDDFPADKVRDVVYLAKKSSSQMSYGFTSSVVMEKPNPVDSTSSPRDGLPPRPHAATKQHVVSSNKLKEKVGASISEAGPSSSKAQEEFTPSSSEGNGSDLPIARRSSLHRFLEKRKDRAALRGPYQNPNQDNLAPKGDEPLDLNSFPETD